MMCIVKMSKKIHEWCHCQLVLPNPAETSLSNLDHFPSTKKNALKVTAILPPENRHHLKRKCSSSKQRFSGVNCKLAVS